MSAPSDSPIGWVNKHIQRYVESDGVDGHLWRGLPTLLLTVTGRKTGSPRRTALIYAQDGEDLVVVASNGGSAEHPLWYRNLVADPQVHVQVGTDRFDALATTAGPDDRPRLWALAAAVFPTYDSYQAKAEREIPVVLLTRREEPVLTRR